MINVETKQIIRLEEFEQKIKIQSKHILFAVLRVNKQDIQYRFLRVHDGFALFKSVGCANIFCIR